ncbi:MAG TPA: type II toxin-antitoxin system VapC family toxin [Afifellaceae bacterium]|nr:type II toxin-antitoxin system VapC family toxin [Afifellaceae bacterium]
MIVVDASAMVEALLQTAASRQVEIRLFEGGETIHAPHLIDLEVTQALRRYALGGEVAAERCRMALDAMAAFPLIRHAHDLLLPRIWELRQNVSAYDGAYVALAEFLGAPLITRDRRLAAAPGHCARIDLV